MRNISQSVSSTSATSWMICSRASAVAFAYSAGTSSSRTFSPSSPSKKYALPTIGSMIPLNEDSAPMGTWSFTGRCPSFSLSISATRS